MRIKQAFPWMFERAYPAVDPETPILSVLPLLRFHEIDVLPLSFGSERKQKGIFGFSCLARLMHIRPEELASFLKQPCEAVSESLTTVRAERALSGLLDAFQRRRFGFARVVESKGVGALLSLPDFLGLYESGLLRSSLTLEDVGSTTFSMPGSSTVRDALVEMFDRRIRRVFVSGSRTFVWDRSIIGHLFSPATLARVIKHEPEDVLGTPISRIETVIARKVDGVMLLREAAALLKVEPGQCLVFDGQVATPWDIVMKPWKEGTLKIRN
ncbi:MAG TPA: hypothetical protein VLY82_04480 [Nitrososphaerales archaeon]|nr:hypothetical protein [Nitrososphaerales archaeon]